MINQNESDIARIFLRTIFDTPGLIRELNADAKGILQSEADVRQSDLASLHNEEKLSVYLELVDTKLEEEKDRRSTLESKAQSMIGFITFSVTLVSVFMANANALLNHGIWGLPGKVISIILLTIPSLSMILSGVFARNIVITEYRHVYASYVGSEVGNNTKEGLLKQRIKDANMSIRSLEIFNNFKGTCLKYAHISFKTAMYSFAAFIIWTMVLFGFGGTPKTKESGEIDQLRRQVISLEVELKGLKQLLRPSPLPSPLKLKPAIKKPVTK